MATKKYIKNNAGVLTEEATVDASAGAGDSAKLVSLDPDGVLDHTIVNAKTTSAGAADADKLPALDAAGKLDNSFMPVGIAADTASILVAAGNSLSAGDFVNIFDNTGPECQLADASDISTQAHGFVIAAYSAAQTAVIYFEGSNDFVTGLTAGNVFLDAVTAGGVTGAAPSGTAEIVQRLGVATSATSMNVELGQPVVLA